MSFKGRDCETSGGALYQIRSSAKPTTRVTGDLMQRRCRAHWSDGRARLAAQAGVAVRALGRADRGCAVLALVLRRQRAAGRGACHGPASSPGQPLASCSQELLQCRVHVHVL